MNIIGTLRDHIPEGLLPAGTPALIAGGYAACPALASDLDLWVYAARGGKRTMGETRMMLLEHLKTWAYKVEAQDDSEQFTADGCGYDELDCLIMKVGIVSVNGRKPIHLMVTDAPPIALLMNFDISTHQIGLDDNGVIYGPEWTDLTVEPQVIKNAGTSKTTERLAKISARYAHLRKAA